MFVATERRFKERYFLSRIFPRYFLSSVNIDEISNQSGKQDSFKHTLNRLMFLEVQGVTVRQNNYWNWSESDTLRKWRAAISVLTVSGFLDILFRFRLLLEGRVIKEIQFFRKDFNKKRFLIWCRKQYL